MFSLYPRSISLSLSSLYLLAQWCRSWWKYVFWRWVCGLWLLLIWVCGVCWFLGLWVCGVCCIPMLIYGFVVCVDLWVCGVCKSKSKSTTHLEKISNSEWNQVYAFSKDLIQVSLGLVVHGGQKSRFEFCVFCIWFQSIRKSCWMFVFCKFLWAYLFIL